MSEDVYAFLQDAADRSASDPVRTTIRDFIARWSAKRRGYHIVEQIRRDLARYNLRTVPDFTAGWIDNSITILPVVASDAQESLAVRRESSETVDSESGTQSSEVTIRIGGLESASGPICSVTLDTSLNEAQSLMMRHDYSQLAVMSGIRDLRGAISWESIAQAKLRDPSASLRDALVEAPVVRRRDSLLDHVPLIIKAGFVFVRDDDNSICGIVTTADLGAEFATLANPFFLLGEIERRLRAILDSVFSQEELAELVDPTDTSRDVASADDLSMGEYVRILENPGRWERVGLSADRPIFIEALQGVKEIRNDVMHFSPDPLEPSQVEELRNFLGWLKALRPL